MSLIVLGVVAFFFIRRQRQGGGTQSTPQQTSEPSEPPWVAKRLASMNATFDPYREFLSSFLSSDGG